jgi:hypothetical protein
MISDLPNPGMLNFTYLFYFLFYYFDDKFENPKISGRYAHHVLSKELQKCIISYCRLFQYDSDDEYVVSDVSDTGFQNFEIKTLLPVFNFNIS